MINELHGLSNALKNANVSTADWNENYGPIPKAKPSSPCIRIWLSDDGAVCGLEALPAEQANLLRKYGNNQQTFPAFNISALYRVIDAETKKELEKIEKGKKSVDIEKIKAWCQNDNWIKKHQQVIRCLDSCPKELAKILSDQPSFKGSIIYKLMGLCELLLVQSDGFRKSLEAYIFEKLQKGDDVRLMLSLLFYKGTSDKEPKNDVGPNLSVILDVQNWRKFQYPVASEHTTFLLNRMLQTAKIQAHTQEPKEAYDAFGMPFIHLGKPMPNVRLTGFDVTLRSMYRGQPSQYRYCKIDDASYPISRENRATIKAALEWLGATERRGITWEHAGNNKIVFAYPTKLPEIPLKAVSFFSSGSAKPSERNEARFESITREFIQAFQGLPTDQRPEMFQVFTIRKMDNARSKVIFTHNTTPEALVQAAKHWTAGCTNLPPLDVGALISPFPLSVSVFVNNVWKHNGELAQGKNAVSRMKPYQGIELLLGRLPADIIRSILHFTLLNASGLMVHLGNWLHGGRTFKGKGEINHIMTRKNDAMLVLCIIGLLLYQSKIEKEKYMEELAFSIGQLLHISDDLHALYCQVKRNGDIPPQLAGNALFVAAGTTPMQALAQLSTRMNPYVAWAKQYRFGNVEEKGKESWRAWWLLDLFEKLSDKIKPLLDKNSRFGDYEKAQLFIGYMASLPSKKKNESTEKANESDIGGKNGQ